MPVAQSLRKVSRIGSVSLPSLITSASETTHWPGPLCCFESKYLSFPTCLKMYVNGEPRTAHTSGVASIKGWFLVCNVKSRSVFPEILPCENDSLSAGQRRATAPRAASPLLGMLAGIAPFDLMLFAAMMMLALG